MSPSEENKVTEESKTVRLCALCPERMNLYGEWGNLSVLTARLISAGLDVVTDRYEGGAAPDLMTYDFLYLGSGTEQAQLHTLNLLTGLKEALLAYVSAKKLFLATGSGAELLGQTLICSDGSSHSGLALGGYSVRQSDRRISGDVIADFLPENLPSVIGYVNCCGVWSATEQPMFSLTFGKNHGNNGKDPAEGFVRDGLYATRLIGPLLVRNPHLLDYFAGKLAEEKGLVLPQANTESAPYEAWKRSLAGLHSRKG